MNKRFQDWIPPEVEEGKLTKWNWMVRNKENLEIGERTDIGAFTFINAKYGVTISDGVQIGSHCSLYSESTIDDKTGAICLGKGSSIGTHSTIMPGVTVGENSIVGAYSFVTEDIPSNSTAVGVPAKVIKRRK